MGVLVALVETYQYTRFFGGNMMPRSAEEFICDGLFCLVALVSVCMIHYGRRG
jgi:hypothetical protein